MKTIKGPGIFLAQFLEDEAPYNNFQNICKWVSSLGYKGIQIPTWDKRCFDLEKVATSQAYADEIKGIANDSGLVVAELSTHLQGQLVAVNPAYDAMFDNFAPDQLKGRPKERTKWAIEQLKYAAKASHNLGIDVHATFSGSLLWHMVYPWPQRPKGIVALGFDELAKRWKPILDTFDEYGVDICYEAHPGEDIHDGITF